MLLHILGYREKTGLNLFDKSLCDVRWTLDHYKSSEQIFSDEAHNPTEESVVQVSGPQKSHCLRYESIMLYISIKILYIV